MSDIKEGDHVSWNWGSSTPSGIVSEIVDEPGEKIVKTIKGKPQTRKAEEGNPALFIEREQKSLNPVVKKMSEVNTPDKTSNGKVQTRRQKALAADEEE